MHIGAVMVFEGPAADVRGLPRPHRVAAAPGAALPAEAGLPALRDGAPDVGRRPALQHRLPRASHRAARARAASSSCALLTGRIFSQRLDRSKPLWELWLVQGLEDNRFALINKTHHSLVDGVSGVDLTTVAVRHLADADAGRRARAGPGVEPCDATLVAEGVKELVARPFALRPARAAAPPAAAETAAELREAARGWARHRLEADQPAAADDAAQPADRPAPARALAALPARRPEGDQERARRHGQRRLPGGRLGRARGAGCAAAASAPRDSSCAASCRSRSAATTTAARSATGSPRCSGRCRSSARPARAVADRVASRCRA